MQTAAWAMSRHRSMRVSMAARSPSERPFQADAVAASTTTTSRSTKAAVTQAAASGGAGSGPSGRRAPVVASEPEAMMMMPFSEAVDWNMEIDSRIVAVVCGADETEASPLGTMSVRVRRGTVSARGRLREHRPYGGSELVDDDGSAAGQVCGQRSSASRQCPRGECAVRSVGSGRTGDKDRDRTTARRGSRQQPRVT